MNTFGSLFSGAGLMDLALEKSGWSCAFQCEIDPEARRVLVHRWPGVECHEDVTKIDPARLPTVRLLAGGSPCQDWSVAGKRAGLAGGRSGLFFHFIRVADAIAPEWVLWENVPGVLSACSCELCRTEPEFAEEEDAPEWDDLNAERRRHRGRDFAIVLEEFTGWKPEVPEDGWRTSGVCWGPKRGACWRVLDSQYVGGCALHRDERGIGPVPQRRRRIFLVAHSGDVGGLGAQASRRNLSAMARLPVQVLFEQLGGDGDLEAGGAAKADVAATLRSRTANAGVNPPGRGGEDDSNLVAGSLMGSNGGISSADRMGELVTEAYQANGSGFPGSSEDAIGNDQAEQGKELFRSTVPLHDVHGARHPFCVAGVESQVWVVEKWHGMVERIVHAKNQQLSGVGAPLVLVVESLADVTPFGPRPKSVFRCRFEVADFAEPMRQAGVFQGWQAWVLPASRTGANFSQASDAPSLECHKCGFTAGTACSVACDRTALDTQPACFAALIRGSLVCHSAIVQIFARPEQVSSEAGAVTLAASDDNGSNQIVAAPLTAGSASGEGVNHPGRRREDDEDLVAHTLTGVGFDAGEDGTGRGTPLVVGTLQAHTKKHGHAMTTRQAAECGQLIPVAYTVNAAESCAKESHAREVDVVRSLDTTGGFASAQGGTVISEPTVFTELGEGHQTYEESQTAMSQRTGGGGGDKKATLVSAGMTVRRLTPTECLRLQGAPDNFLDVDPPLSDGAKYRLCGNGVSIPPVSWIARRILESSA